MKESVVYTKDNCTYCSQAKNFLLNLGVPYTERKIATEEDKQELLTLVPSARTMPQIFLSGVHIGGFSELKALYDAGKLFISKDGSVIIQ